MHSPRRFDWGILSTGSSGKCQMDLFHYWYTPMLAAKGTQQYPSEWYSTDSAGIGGSKHTQPLFFYSFELFFIIHRWLSGEPPG